MNSAEKIFRDAFGAFNSRNYDEAERLFRKFLKGQPSHVGALNLLTVVLMGMERFAEAEAFIARAVKLNRDSDVSFYNYGLILKALDKPQQALEQFTSALRLNSKAPETWNNRGTVYNDLKQYEKAIDDFDQAISLHPGYGDAVANKGKSLSELRLHDQALAAYDRALSLKPDLAEAWLGRGKLSVELKRFEEALAAYDKALSFKPDLVDAQFGRGNALFFLKRYEEAVAAYDTVLSSRPDLAEGWLGRGNAVANLKRYEEALAAYDMALSFKPGLTQVWLGRGNVLVDLERADEAVAIFDKVVSLEPDLAEGWLGRGNAFAGIKRHDDAFIAYDKALSINADLAEAWLGRGNAFVKLKRYDEGFAAYDRALLLKPDLAQVWLCRGNSLLELKRHGEALDAYGRALSLESGLATAWLGRGNVFLGLRHYQEAFFACDMALSLKPDLFGVEGMRLHSKMQLCDWSDFDAESDRLVRSFRNGKENTGPFELIGVGSSAEDQLKCARLWVRKTCPPAETALWRGELYENPRIRIGYVSADFRPHPVADLISGVFESHDKSRFEVFGISIGPNDSSGIRQRLERSVDKFIDAAELHSDEIAKTIRREEIDILVDLNGLTQHSRTEIFACRPAPVQVNYLGYPGTMGATYIDYIVADPTLIPAAHRSSYAEKVVYLPHSYLPHDDLSRRISDRPIERGEFGLPETGFVFCCFNNAYKLNPHLFRSRMKILRAVEGSVLWLSEHNAAATDNLRKEAAAAGVNPDRLVFAGRVASMADHLARHRLADLFLDTLPYNAHTTASDALWAGLPVLTQIGETFAGRVAASLLTAIGLPELIVQTQAQFETTAIELARRLEMLAAIKARLAENRLTRPLFNTRSYTRHIEAAYAAMHQRRQSGLPPDHIHVAEQI